MDKENLAPQYSGRARTGPFAGKKESKGRSKSIGPGGLGQSSVKNDVKFDAKDRRKSAYASATKSIISSEQEKAERQAARRKTLANRRVSFAPEATLHTWDVIELPQDATTSTESSDHTQRARYALEQEELLLEPPNESEQGLFNEIMQEEDDVELDDHVEHGSLARADNVTVTIASLESESPSSTNSSARLEAALRQAAQTAGTRGIEFDEFGDDDVSMELAEEEITAAFKPWARHVYASDENASPFASATKLSNDDDDDDSDQSMDVTRAVGRIVPAPEAAMEEDESDDASMDVTQAVGGILDDDQTEGASMDLTKAIGKIQGSKRRRSTTELGSPIASSPAAQAKRRQLTAIGNGLMASVQNGSPTKPGRRRSLRSRTSGMSDQEGATMDLTQAVGRIQDADSTSWSHDENEDLTLERVPALGRIKISDNGPSTPKHQTPLSVRLSPKDPERFIEPPDSGPKKLLTPILQKQVNRSAEKMPSSDRRRQTIAPSKVSWTGAVFDETKSPKPQASTSSHQLRASSRSPRRPSPFDETQVKKSPSAELTASIRLMSTPRKEALKNLTPKKGTLQLSPPKMSTSTIKLKEPTPELPSSPKMSIQQFLDMANIHFMDMTATARRATMSRAPYAQADEEGQVSLSDAVVAAACIQPEHDMFQHACHELKHYINEGKQVIQRLEAQVLRETPPLMAAYSKATGAQKAELDAKLRDIKMHARLKSKEMWYSWRSQLLDDLLKGLSTIGEGMIQDDETLRKAEEVVRVKLPPLLETYKELQRKESQLLEAAAAVKEEDQDKLQHARSRLMQADAEIENKKKILAELKQKKQEISARRTEVQDRVDECKNVIAESKRRREATRGFTIDEIDRLNASIKEKEAKTGWNIVTACDEPPSVTMNYRSHLQIFFNGCAFANAKPSMRPADNANGPISLTYIGKPKLTTTLRFFLQLIRARLHALPQHRTQTSSMLKMVSSGWDVATKIAEFEAGVNERNLLNTRIVSDEHLSVAAKVLIIAAKTRLRVVFDVHVAGDDVLQLSVNTSVSIDYGRANKIELNDRLGKMVNSESRTWGDAVEELKKLCLKMNEGDDGVEVVS
ncbi:Spc7-domain-containing protein [Piedraia hortae CBS 480.64]|uniref:Spc7-domain-containing protein n=1 Tax=Piedraia hortae CBS 480.64 TaxID=1314780 RepID=A0A6A7C7R1_9PEZI|nr:Spc7-domain-containing protein [Piedraia hortae CBS 480.64]